MGYDNEQYGLVQTTPPAEEPVTVAEAKLYCRIDRPEEDALITELIKAGRERCERVTARQLVTATWKLTLDRFPKTDSEIRLPRPPLVSVTTVKYVDTAGTLQTVAGADYLVDAATLPGRIWPAYGKTWPTPRCQPAAVEIVFVAGYGAATAVPNEFKERIKTYVAFCFENRETRDDMLLDRIFAGLWCGDYK